MIISKASFSVVSFIVITLLIVPFITASAGTVQLPQTGQTKCYDTAGTEIACTGTGQDGEIQAGVPWPNPRFTDNSDGTVTDNLTGLMWVQSPDSIIRKWATAIDYCNNLNFAGYTDWRLPNVNEIESLFNADEPDPAVWLNTQGFTNVQLNHYWSSNTFKRRTDDAWYVNMINGNAPTYYKYSQKYVWPVRSASAGTVQLPQTGQTKCYDSAGTEINCAGTGQDGELQKGVTWPEPRFTDNSDGTVTDNLTGLMWTKDANPDYPHGNGTWQEGLNYCNNLNFAGYTDWRLPNREEIRSLIDYSHPILGGSIPAGAPFTHARDRYYASSTLAGNTSYAPYLYIDYGYMYSNEKLVGRVPWPVRSGITETTAITLSSFKAKQRGKKVLIKWKTASEIDNLGFIILRSDSENGEYTKINKKLIPAKKNAVSGAKYKFKDRGITKGKTYYYKLEDIDKTTGSSFNGPVEVKVKGKAHKKKNKK